MPPSIMLLMSCGDSAPCTDCTLATWGVPIPCMKARNATGLMSPAGSADRSESSSDATAGAGVELVLVLLAADRSTAGVDGTALPNTPSAAGAEPEAPPLPLPNTNGDDDAAVLADEPNPNPPNPLDSNAEGCAEPNGVLPNENGVLPKAKPPALMAESGAASNWNGPVAGPAAPKLGRAPPNERFMFLR